MRIWCLDGEKRKTVERDEKVRLDFTLEVFKQNASRWTEDLSRSIEH